MMSCLRHNPIMMKVMSAWQGNSAMFQLSVALSYCFCITPVLQIVGFAHAQCIIASLLYFVFPSSSVLSSICSVTWATKPQTLLQSLGRELSKHLHPVGTQESSFMQEQKLPPVLAGVVLHLFFTACPGLWVCFLQHTHCFYASCPTISLLAAELQTVCKNYLQGLFTVAYPRKNVAQFGMQCHTSNLEA